MNGDGPDAGWLVDAPFARWSLGLEGTRPDGATVRLVFERAWPGWIWLLVVALAVGLAWWSYRGLRGPVRARIALAALRTSLLVTLAVLLAGPALRIATELVERDWVVFLVDRSRSMEIADAGTVMGETTRDQALRAALAEAAPALARLAEGREPLWLGFSGGAFELPVGEGGPELPAPTGDRTRLEDALLQAMGRTAARPVAGIVVLSDGRSAPPVGRNAIRRLQAEAIPVFAVPFGSETPGNDLAIAKVETPGRVFVGDEVPVRVEAELVGDGVVAATVRLLDEETGEELARAELGPADGVGIARATLLPRPARGGVADWRITIESAGDLVADNNDRTVRVEIVDRPLRVLYIDGYPRWEYRYLKNLLIRERTIDSSIMLLSADRDFAQEGNMPIARLPRTAEEFALFDVIMLGDVDAGFFSPEQLEAMRDQVARKGAGLMWIGGERSMPRSWEGTAMADLLPMRAPLALPTVPGPVTVTATPLAEDLALLRLGTGEAWPAELSDPSVGWSRLAWAQSIPPEQLKPTVETLAIATPVDPALGGAVPLVVSMRFGAGTTIYVATDEFWRYRYGRGERYTEQVWLPLVRMLGREALASGEGGFALRAIPARVRPGEPVRIELQVADAAIADRAEGGFPASVRPPENASDAGPSEIELVRRPDSAEWSASWAPERVGRHIVRIESGAATGAEVAFECERPDDEVRNSAADHASLAALAAASEGAMLEPRDLADLDRRLPRREVRTETATLEPIWDSPLAFALVLLLASLEWLGRRIGRLA